MRKKHAKLATELRLLRTRIPGERTDADETVEYPGNSDTDQPDESDSDGDVSLLPQAPIRNLRRQESSSDSEGGMDAIQV